MATTPKTATGAFGRPIADELAAWAIDTMLYPPTKIDTYTTRVPAHRIREGREILDRAGVDWRTIKESQS